MHKAIIDKLKLTPTFHYEMWGNFPPQVPVYEYKDGLFVSDGRAVCMGKRFVVIFNGNINNYIAFTPEMVLDPEMFKTYFEKYKNNLYESTGNNNQ